MFRVGKILRSLDFLIVQPVPGCNNEILLEYKVFFDDLDKEYASNLNREFKEILMITADRRGYRHRFRNNDGSLQEVEIKKDFYELLNSHYDKYKTAIQKSQRSVDKAELQGLIQYINGIGTWDIFFHQMHYITQDAIHFSISKLNPQIHKVNKFFIDFFNMRDGVRHEHQKVFNFSHTLRSPYFRGTIISYVSNNLDALERSPLFIMFTVPHNLTQFGEERLPEIISLFEEKMAEYESKNGITIARDCYRKPHEMNERKLKKIINDLTRKSENELRKSSGLPNVGEGWVQEIILFHKIQIAFPELEVINHGKPKWLGDQHLDIWIPSRNIGIEYNGQQHYEAIEFFGGGEGLRKQQDLDERKAALCFEHGIRLFVVRYDDDMDIAVSRIRQECR